MVCLDPFVGAVLIVVASSIVVVLLRERFLDLGTAPLHLVLRNRSIMIPQVLLVSFQRFRVRLQSCAMLEDELSQLGQLLQGQRVLTLPVFDVGSPLRVIVIPLAMIVLHAAHRPYPLFHDSLLSNMRRLVIV
jgi:hypothetical protein